MKYSMITTAAHFTTPTQNVIIKIDENESYEKYDEEQETILTI